MTPKQKQQFNNMLKCLKKIAKGYQTPNQLRKSSREIYGLAYEEALERAYVNIKSEAAYILKGIKEIAD